MKLPFLISGLVVITFLTCSAQQGLVKHFGVEDGLGSNCVYAAFQDRQGYIWLATTNGVSRFDGKKFKNFTSNNGLPDNEIFGIAEDALGRIWLSCYNGEPCYIYNNKVYTAAEDTLLKVIPRKSYFRFYRVGSRLMLVRSAGGDIYEIDETGKILKTPLKGVAFLIFKNNLLNILSNKRKNGNIKHYLLDNSYRCVDSLVFPWNNSDSPPAIQVADTYASGANGFVVLLKNGTCLQYSIRHNRIVFMHATANVPPFREVYHIQGKQWINVYNKGLIPVTGKFEPDPQRETLFPQKAIQYFMVDREGNYWACTSGQGLYMVPNNHFLYYHTGIGAEQNGVLKLAACHGQIYLACGNALFKYTGHKVPEPDSLNAFIHLPDRIVDLYADSQGVIAATPEAILVINQKSKKIKKINADASNVKCLRRGNDHSFFFGTHSTCYQYFFPDSLINIYRGRTVAVYPRRNGDVLIGTLFGLFIVRKNKQGGWITDTVRFPGFLKETNISCIDEVDDIIVTGTVQKGLLLIHGRDYECVNLGQGLKDINCKDIFIDAEKNIWLASFSGVFKITLHQSIHTYSVQHIRKFNGLLSDDVNSLLIARDTAYVAGPNGLSIFPLKSTTAQKQPPALYISEVLVNGILYPVPAKEIRLPSDSNTIDLHFSAIDFKSLGNILFKYRLSNIQKNWSYTADNFVRFEALPPGSYKLELWAMNAENTWSAAPAILLVQIQPAWWQSAWFYALLILAGAGLIYFLVRRSLIKKHSSQMRKNSFKRHLAELELRAIKAQINPHFIFNTLNAIQYFINNQENEKAENYLNRMADLLRKTLEFSDKTTVPVQTEINYLENYLELEKLRFDENFRFTITSQLSASQSQAEIPPMVLQPHVENALRHGFKNKQHALKKLDITFSMAGRQLICEVSDNGIGRKAAAAGYHHEAAYRSRGMELSHSKLLMYESITGKTIKTEVRDNYAEDRQTPTGTSIRIFISQ